MQFSEGVQFLDLCYFSNYTQPYFVHIVTLRGFTLYMLVRSARTLSTSPNVAAPYLESSMQHHATLRHAMARYIINTRYLHFHCLHFIQESYLLFGWQDFGVARFASWAKLKIRHAKPVLACKHPDDMFTLYQIALAQAHGS